MFLVNCSMSAATLKSIAKATGYSVTTVSRALGGYSDVNAETRRVILLEAERQGYEPNLNARLLQGQRANTLGLIMPTDGPRFSDPFFSQFAGGVGNTAAERGFDLLLSTHAPVSPGELDLYRRMVAGRRVDGFVVIRTRQDDPRVRYLLQANIPFVAFGRTHNNSTHYPHIDVDGVDGQRTLTQHFIDRGHRRIAYVAPPDDLMFAHYRMQGYRQTLADNSLPVDATWLVRGHALTEHGGRAAAEYLLDLPVRPTAIMTGNDLMAFGVMSVIQARGLRVGDDIAVGGFDDIPSAEHFHPGLTTMHQPIYDIGRRLTDLLLDIIDGKIPEEQAILMPTTLVIRGSSGPQRA